ncbi:adenosine deaminase [Nocardiopsis sp. CNR-923]|uniref:adenosine deaminase n=1 Tax=Nocardiopsis sp. CNR-923 TaxID=1904965 RepID=UPI00095CD2DF|nr:adenosine deaminase [Nocardiopsis sp. CNR-923]OLT29945.1 adenosine deaminase [Nocardiopsis sp. CNR-923]
MPPTETGEAASPPLDPFIAALPRVELHLHLLGAASPDAVASLARRRPEHGVPTEPDGVRRYFRFTGFAHFVEVYTAVNALVTSGADVFDLVVALAADLAARAVGYAEVTVTPLSHLRAGVAPDALSEALAAGRAAAGERHGVTLNWIFDASGDDGPEGASATLDWVLRQRPEGAVGFGLGGPEDVAPRAPFREVFARARAHGLHSVPHAGETTSAAQVWSAVRDLGAERIGHGVRAVDDPALLAFLADRGITLEVCPTSNLRTGAVSDLDAHPLPALLAAGVPVALGSDDPAMFDTDLDAEYRQCHDRWGMPPARLLDLAENAVRAAYCGESLRTALLDRVGRLRAWLTLRPAGERSSRSSPGVRAPGSGHAGE